MDTSAFPETMNRERPRVLLTVSGGGFFWQSRAVARALCDDFEVHYVSAESSGAFDGQGLPEAPFHEIFRVTTMIDQSLARQAMNLARSLSGVRRVFRAVAPDAVVCVATSLAIPLCVWARLHRRQTVFIESATRVSRPSVTGRVLTALRLCDRFYVQWPEAAKLYSGAIYRGSLL